MKQGYLIAVDLDGTLIQGFDNYDKKSFEYLKEIAINNYVVIATGRPFRSSKYYYDILNLNTPIINYNGALVFHPNDDSFSKRMITVSKETIIKIFNDNKNIISNIFCEIEDEIFLYREEKEINSYLHLDGGNLHIGDFEKILYDDPNGAICFSKKENEKILEEYIKDTFKGSLKIRFWDDENYCVGEIYNPLTNKGNGINKIISFYNIPFEKTIAIGDGHNDIELFENVNIGVAMANSHKDLIQCSKYVTTTVKEHGVYNFLKSFFEDKDN